MSDERRMAPLCVCGHRASEHHKQMGMRTHCTWEIELEHASAPWENIIGYCPCKIYRPREGK